MASRVRHTPQLIWHDTVDDELVAHIGDLALKVRRVDDFDELLIDPDIEGAGEWIGEVVEGPFFDEDDLYGQLSWVRRHASAQEAQRWCADLAAHEELRYVVGMRF